MKKFEGFPDQFEYSRIPAPFFKELLPEIDHLGELAITIYFFWRIDQMEGDFRYLKIADILEDKKLVKNHGKENLEIGLEKAIERGTFLMAQLELDNQKVELIFVSTSRGRKAIDAINEGLWSPSGDNNFPIALDIDQSTVYRLYEENIGALTPLIADALKEAEEIFPFEWIKEAIAKSVENNARSWRYALAILERWQKEGKHAQTKENRRSSEKDRKKYTEW